MIIMKSLFKVFLYEEKFQKICAGIEKLLFNGCSYKKQPSEKLKKINILEECMLIIFVMVSANALLSVRLGESQLFKMNVFDKKNEVIEDFYLYRFHPFEQRRFVVEQSLIDICESEVFSRPSRYDISFWNVKSNQIIVTDDALKLFS